MYKLFSAIGLLFLSFHVNSANLPDFPFVVATGEVQREVRPDMAKISIEIVAFDEDSDKAVEQVSVASSTLLITLKKHGVSANSIEASDIKKNTTRERTSGYT